MHSTKLTCTYKCWTSITCRSLTLLEATVLAPFYRHYHRIQLLLYNNSAYLVTKVQHLHFLLQWPIKLKYYRTTYSTLSCHQNSSSILFRNSMFIPCHFKCNNVTRVVWWMNIHWSPLCNTSQTHLTSVGCYYSYSWPSSCNLLVSYDHTGAWTYFNIFNKSVPTPDIQLQKLIG